MPYPQGNMYQQISIMLSASEMRSKNVSGDVADLFAELGMMVASDREALTVLVERERQRMGNAPRKRGRPRGALGRASETYDRLARAVLQVAAEDRTHSFSQIVSEAAKLISEDNLTGASPSRDAASKGIKAALDRLLVSRTTSKRDKDTILQAHLSQDSAQENK